jgi:hypothetical protein
MTQAAVGSIVVVVLPPASEHLSSILQVHEPMLRQALIQYTATQSFDVSVVNRLARTGVLQPNRVPVGPGIHGSRGELDPIVYRDQLRQLASPLSRLTQNKADVLGTNGSLGHQRTAHSLVRTSTTVRIRMVQPSAGTSCTRSIVHRSLALAAGDRISREMAIILRFGRLRLRASLSSEYNR